MATVESAIDSACGPGDTFCKASKLKQYQTGFKSDACSVRTETSENEKKVDDFFLWVPDYRKSQCEINGHALCGNYANRFGPRQVRQESFLTGRGQVTVGPECEDTDYRFLPKEVFEGQPKRKSCFDMSLAPQETRSKRSCGSVSEMDMAFRWQPLPGVYQNDFGSVGGLHQVPTIYQGVKSEKTATLGTHKYPSWESVHSESAPYK